jgi:hypothetical protein
MARIRKKAGEHLSEENIERVISLLDQEKPITKKEACEILNISYNTTRLNKIIEGHRATLTQRAELRKRFRNKPLEKEDIKLIISSYLEGVSLVDISNNLFRSVALIKRTLIKYHIPLRDASIDYWNPIEVPIEVMQDDYIKEDLVYSARYNQPACVMKKLKEGIYRIWLYKDHQYALQPYYELSDLRHIQKDFGVVVEDFPADEIKRLIYTALTNAKRKKK